MAQHEHETGTTQGAMTAPALPMQEDTMDTMLRCFLALPTLGPLGKTPHEASKRLA